MGQIVTRNAFSQMGGAVYPNYLQREYLPQGGDTQPTAPPPLTSPTASSGNQIYNGRVYSQQGQLLGQQSSLGNNAVIGRDARGNPIVVQNGVARVQPLQGAASHVAYESGNPDQPQIDQNLDMQVGARRASIPTQGAQDTLIAQGRKPLFYSDGTAIFAEGGRITEPVVGVGVHTGRRYVLGEAGSETVTPDNPRAGAEYMRNLALNHDNQNMQGDVHGYQQRTFLPDVTEHVGGGFKPTPPPFQFQLDGRTFTTFSDSSGQRHVRDEASGATMPVGGISERGVFDRGLSDSSVIGDSSIVNNPSVIASGPAQSQLAQLGAGAGSPAAGPTPVPPTPLPPLPPPPPAITAPTATPTAAPAPTAPTPTAPPPPVAPSEPVTGTATPTAGAPTAPPPTGPIFVGGGKTPGGGGVASPVFTVGGVPIDPTAIGGGSSTISPEGFNALISA